jgi:hypothetical protein
MGTRADFYVDRPEGMEWVGSVAFDGWPGATNAPVGTCSEEEFRAWFDALPDDYRKTLPSQGWPWPWDSSDGTDYAYLWSPDEGGMIKVASFGYGWISVAEALEEDWPPRKEVGFPVMVPPADPLHERSGVIVVAGRP